MTSDDVLKKLNEGNQRFCDGKHTLIENLAQQRTVSAAEGQKPHTTVLTCSDSRVPPEILFDQGIGELFVVRVAGNVVGDNVVGSIEFAVKKLQTPVLVVLGHTDCGAVTAAVNQADVPANVQKILDRIHHPISKVRELHNDLDELTKIDKSIEENACHAIEQILEHSEVVAAAAEEETLRIVPAIYRIDTGKVVWLEGR